MQRHLIGLPSWRHFPTACSATTEAGPVGRVGCFAKCQNGIPNSRHARGAGYRAAECLCPGPCAGETPRCTASPPRPLSHLPAAGCAVGWRVVLHLSRMPDRGIADTGTQRRVSADGRSSACALTGNIYLGAPGEGFASATAADVEGYGASGDEADECQILLAGAADAALERAQLDAPSNAGDIVDLTMHDADDGPLVVLIGTGPGGAGESAEEAVEEDGGAKESSDIDEQENEENPAGWPVNLFTERFDRKSKKSKGRMLPTGLSVVPTGEDGRRMRRDWQFHYAASGVHMQTGNPSRTLVEDGPGLVRGSCTSRPTVLWTPSTTTCPASGFTGAAKSGTTMW